MITAAALLFAVAMGAFVFSDLVYVKEVAVGAAVAVLVDATIVRAFLLPGGARAARERGLVVAAVARRQAVRPSSADREALAVEARRNASTTTAGELLAGPAKKLLARLLGSDRHPVDAVAGHRLVRVSDGQDRRLEWDLVGGKALRIAGAIRTLVMSAGSTRRTSSSSRLERMRAPSSGWRLICVHLVRRSAARACRGSSPERRSCRCRGGSRPGGGAGPGPRRSRAPGHHLAEAADGLAVPGGARVALVERLGEAEHRRQLRLGLDVARPGDGAEDVGDLGAVDHCAVAAERLGGVQGPIGWQPSGRPGRRRGRERSRHPPRRVRLDPGAGGGGLRILSSSSSANRKALVLVGLGQARWRTPLPRMRATRCRQAGVDSRAARRRVAGRGRRRRPHGAR